MLSRGTAALGPKMFMRLGKVNEKITISGVVVYKDDILLADENGVVVVRPQQLVEVLELCKDVVEQSRVMLKEIYSGKAMQHALDEGRKLHSASRASPNHDEGSLPRRPRVD